MYCIDADKAGDLWFFTRLASPKTAEVSRDGHVNLAYAHPSKQHYISVLGRAEMVRDKGLIQDKWSEAMRTWFPEGKDDPQLALIRVHPERGEFLFCGDPPVRVCEGGNHRLATPRAFGQSEGRSPSREFLAFLNCVATGALPQTTRI